MPIRDPNLAYAAIVAGVLIGYVELLRPGWIAPGVGGLVLAMLGVASLAEMQPTATGIALLAAAAALCITDAHFRLRGMLACAGVIAMTAGARWLVAEPRIKWWVAAALSGAFVGATTWLLGLAFRARANKMVF